MLLSLWVRRDAGQSPPLTGDGKASAVAAIPRRSAVTKETSMETTRRDVLFAATALPLAAAVAHAPLTQNELRVLATCSLPARVYDGREHEYPIADPGTPVYRVIQDLEARGLVVLVPTPGRRDVQHKALPTQAGLDALRAVGVEVLLA
jgi:hypothetical protein